MATTTPGTNCQACGAFVTDPAVLPHHDCTLFKASHESTTLMLIRAANRKPKGGRA